MSKIRLHGSSSGYTEIAPVAASGNKDPQPTDDELNAAYIQWVNTEQYKGTRVVGTATTSGYGAVTDQLDQLYHDMKDGKLGVAATTGSWYVGITSVKNAFPKPS